MPLIPESTSWASASPDILCVGRSVCVMSPVTTAFESKPRRVRNIFICSIVAFLRFIQDNKRIIERSASHECNRRNSIMFCSMYLSSVSGDIMSYKASYKGRRYGCTFAAISPGKKPQPFTGFNRGTRQDNTIHLPALEGGDRHCHGEVSLPCACGPNAENKVVVLDCFNVPFLSSSFGGESPRASRTPE